MLSKGTLPNIEKNDILEKATLTEPDPAFIRRVKIIFGNLNLKGNERILDLGCGRGFYLKLLRACWPNLELYGVDVNPNYLKVAKKFVADGKVNLKLADANALPFKDNFFDRVIASEVIEHIYERKRPLEEVNRVLKPGGYALISVPNKNYPFLWDPINWFLEKFFKTHFRSDFWTLAGIWADHHRIYSEEELKRDLRDAGFEINGFWFSTRFCFPFSNLIYYGVGMKLVGMGLFSGFNRFNSNNQKSLINTVILWPIREIDNLNNQEKKYKQSVNLIAKAKKV